ncbi:MAG: DUF4388 domain-containing protein [Elainellaceae cyanobacterium]
MEVSGCLSEFSFPELLQFLGRRGVTGLLSLHVPRQTFPSKTEVYHIWLDQGYVVAVGSPSLGKNLLSLITQHGWLSKNITSKLVQMLPTDVPAGIYLQKQGLLQAQEVQLLFYAQVKQQLKLLGQYRRGQFCFDSNSPLPMNEMTGFSIPAGKIAFDSLCNSGWQPAIPVTAL